MNKAKAYRELQRRQNRANQLAKLDAQQLSRKANLYDHDCAWQDDNADIENVNREAGIQYKMFGETNMREGNSLDIFKKTGVNSALITFSRSWHQSKPRLPVIRASTTQSGSKPQQELRKLSQRPVTTEQGRIKIIKETIEVLPLRNPADLPVHLSAVQMMLHKNDTTDDPRSADSHNSVNASINPSDHGCATFPVASQIRQVLLQKDLSNAKESYQGIMKRSSNMFRIRGNSNSNSGTVSTGSSAQKPKRIMKSTSTSTIDPITERIPLAARPTTKQVSFKEPNLPTVAKTLQADSSTNMLLRKKLDLTVKNIEMHNSLTLSSDLSQPSEETRVATWIKERNSHVTSKYLDIPEVEENESADLVYHLNSEESRATMVAI